ncbi:hypothetical protein JM658_11040 [Joostella atrarenae]|uniref:DUF6089 domain-containing protein n=1 Tax=Joostella atrarenae TaxID=679257 RepID=A0ABS9J4P7_9FLAO|nr:DUF6089 family protein [Joostella atrarenae]MCF8715364.1 hypothetical protein [Joostella atrarenae]
MNFRILTIIFMLASTMSYAQMFEVGAFVGGSNYIGDVGSSWYVRPNSLAAGGVFKWNISKRYAYRGSFTYSTLHASDLDSDNSARQSRGYSFSNRILEGSLGMEFNFLEFDLTEFSKSVTPYIYSGVAYTRYGDLFYRTSSPTPSTGDADVSKNKATFAIPMILGIKGKISKRFVLAAEVGARYTFTDNLDGSNPIDPPTSTIVEFGSQYSDDWYVFSGVTLTYTFGKRPCYSCYD